MAFTVTGVATVSDVRDGVSPPTIYLTNENHTFVAEADGDVPDLTGFTSDVQAFVGTTEYTYSTAATPTGTNYTIVSGSISFSPSTANLVASVSSTGEITISDGTQTTGFVHGSTINEVMVTIPVRVAGFSSTFNRVISLSKSIGGSAPIIRLSSNTQTVEYNQMGTVARTANIVLTATEINFTDVASVTWEYRSGATGAFTALSGTGITLNTTDPETATITPAAYNTLLGSNRTVTIRARRGGSLAAPEMFDQITIARVNDGEAAITVVVTPTSGSTVLRSETDAVTLRADVYMAGTLLTPGSDWTYRWIKDGTTLTASNIATQTGNANTGFIDNGLAATSRSITVEGDGITDNMSSLFSATVTDPS